MPKGEEILAPAKCSRKKMAEAVKGLAQGLEKLEVVYKEYERIIKEQKRYLDWEHIRVVLAIL